VNSDTNSETAADSAVQRRRICNTIFRHPRHDEDGALSKWSDPKIVRLIARTQQQDFHIQKAIAADDHFQCARSNLSHCYNATCHTKVVQISRQHR